MKKTISLLIALLLATVPLVTRGTEIINAERLPSADINANLSAWDNVACVSYDEIRHYDNTEFVMISMNKALMESVCLPSGECGLIFWGWIGTKKEISGFSYTIDGGESVSDDAFTYVAEPAVASAAARGGAEYWSRFKIKLQIEKTPVTVRIYVNYSDGTEEAFWVCTVENNNTDGDIRWHIDDDGNMTVYGSGDMPQYEWETTPWHEAGADIKSLTVEQGVTSICDEAFQRCTALKSVILADSVNNIGSSAFEYCIELTEVNLPNGLSEISEYTFHGCVSLSKIQLPVSVEKIGDHAFYDCRRMSISTMPDSLKQIGDFAFYNCDIKTLSLPDGVCDIGIGAFASCKGLTSITVENGNLTYRSENNCVIERKTNKLVIGCSTCDVPNGVSAVCAYAFDGCVLLDTVTLPDSVTALEEYAFAYCTSLSKVVFPESLLSVGNNAFYKCTSLSSVSLPYSIKKIECETFFGCTSLESIDLSANIETIGDRAFWGCGTLKNVSLPEKIAAIGNGAFEMCVRLEKLEIPEGIINVGDRAFYGCASLKNVSFPESLRSIGVMTFAHCDTIEKIYIPKNVALIGKGAFSACDALKTLEVASNNAIYYDKGNCVIKINGKILSVGCNASVIPNDGSVEAIGEYAFYGCDAIADIIVPNGVKRIGEYAFADCSSLCDIVFSSDVLNIESYAFAYCTSLTQVDMPHNIESTGKRAFYSCLTLRRANFSGELPKKQGVNAFEYCDAQFALYAKNEKFDESLNVWSRYKRFPCGEATGTIGDNGEILWKFDSSGFLTITGEGEIVNRKLGYTENWNAMRSFITEIHIGDGVSELGEYSFRGCTELSEVVIPNSVKYITDSAFSGCTPTIVCEKGSYAEKYAKEKKLAFLYYKEKDGVIIEWSGDGVPDNATVDVLIRKKGNDVIFDLQLACGKDVHTKLDTTVTVKLNSAELLEMTAAVLYDIDNGTPLPIQARFACGMLTFECDSFGVFAVTETEYLATDANGDGVINTSDILALDAYLNGKSEKLCFLNADVNCDGEADMTDMNIMIEAIMKNK